MTSDSSPTGTAESSGKEGWHNITDDTLIVFINTKRYLVKLPDPKQTLISFLRSIGLTGTKLGCAEGGCGSCTVVVGSFDMSERLVKYISLNSCLAPLCSLHLKHVITIEGLGNSSNLHPIQKALACTHSSQCGYCTPGIVMSLYAQLKGNPKSSDHEIEDCFDGNLCRCTGYRPILEGAKTFSTSDIEDLNVCYGKSLQFPKELFDLVSKSVEPISYSFELNGVKWIHPSSLSELLEVMELYPHAKIVNGNTEIGIETRFKNMKYPILVNANEVKDLKKMVLSEGGFEIGTGYTWTEVTNILIDVLHKADDHKNRAIKCILNNIKYFAGHQVRNVSTIAGNICTASPISDLNPVWVALGAHLRLQSKSSIRLVPMSEFFLGYRKTAIKPSEVAVSLFVPLTREHEYCSSFKQAKRRDDDIAIVNAAFRVLLDENLIVKEACLAFGGLGPTTLIAKSSSEFLVGKKWELDMTSKISEFILGDFPLPASAPGGQVHYRKTLGILYMDHITALSFFHKFLIQSLHEIGSTNQSVSIPKEMETCMVEIERGVSKGEQIFDESTESSALGKSMMHLSGLKQVTGEALYVDDLPRLANELYGAIVSSSHASAEILSVNPDEALKMDGVIDYISHEDLSPEKNSFGPVFKDEELFASKEVFHVGQMIGLIIAESEEIAREAAKHVKIQYNVRKPIITIEDAISANSFFSIERSIRSGAYSDNSKTDVPLSIAEHFVEGKCRIAGQEHFYLETNASLVVPSTEDDEIEVFSSSQNPTESQHLVAHVLGIDSNKVVARVKRLGGGFGGKETRSAFLSCALAVAAKKHKVPVRCMLSREEDMAITGMRHPYLGHYKVGFTSEGKLISLELDVFNNAGYSIDLSIGVLERSIAHCENAYRIPNVRVVGKMCKTNLPTNTAFRGFGAPQGMMIAETYISHVAAFLKKEPEVIRMMNLYNNGDVTHYSMPLENVHLREIWDELIITSNFMCVYSDNLNRKRKEACRLYNKDNKYRKRGIAIIPTKFGIAFSVRFLNQAGALVHIYTDGSVRISHGGTEMGQGLHTKMVQIVSHELGIPVSLIHLSETRTDTVANTSPTAASASSDLNGMALVDACRKIMERLAPIKEANPGISWKDLVKKAYFNCINLSSNGHYASPDLTYDWATNLGRMYRYYTYGVACTEVEIDTLTGDHVVLRSDIIMDVGRSLNPAIDIGQIEGAFIQGQGWCTIEEPLFSSTTGVLMTRGPGFYKIPGFKDIPVDFRVQLVKGVRNDKAVHSSKGVGEPPLFLGGSVFWAIKDAIQQARSENGNHEYFELRVPATSERIRLSCEDELVRVAETPLKENETVWAIPG